MNELYIMNRILTERIQSHTESRGSLDDSEDDDDITMLETFKPASSPSYKSSPTWTARSVRIQLTALHSNSVISPIRCPNKVFSDALETWQWDTSFGLGPSSRMFVDHSVWSWQGVATPIWANLALYRVRPSAHVVGAAPRFAPNPSSPLVIKLSSHH